MRRLLNTMLATVAAALVIELVRDALDVSRDLGPAFLLTFAGLALLILSSICQLLADDAREDRRQ